MTVSVISVVNRPASSTGDESAVIGLEQRIQAGMRGIDGEGQPVMEGVNGPDNLALCNALIIKQIMMDMVSKNENDQEWKEKWF